MTDSITELADRCATTLANLSCAIEEELLEDARFQSGRLLADAKKLASLIHDEWEKKQPEFP